MISVLNYNAQQLEQLFRMKHSVQGMIDQLRHFDDNYSSIVSTYSSSSSLESLLQDIENEINRLSQ